MVKVYRNVTVENKVRDMLRYKKKVPVKGYAVTMLTCCSRKTYFGKLGLSELPPEGRELVFTRGKAHHEVLEVFRPNEVRVSRDGIKGDIDMIGNRVTEIFTTNLSSTKVKVEEDVPKVFAMKTKQLKAYLYMVGEVEGDLMVFFLFGDYTRLKVLPGGKVRYTGATPELKDWTMVFEEKELTSNWKELLAKRDFIEDCLKSPVPEAVLALTTSIRDLWVKWRDGRLGNEVVELMARRKLFNEHSSIPDWVGEKFECKQCGYAYICPEYNEEVSRL